jgi:hypothetical protein
MEVQLYQEQWDDKHCIELLGDLMKYWNIHYKQIYLEQNFLEDWDDLRWKTFNAQMWLTLKENFVTKSLNKIHPVLNDILL